MPDSEDANDLERFRSETHRWLLENAPPSMREPLKSENDLCWGGKKREYPADVKRWLQVMAERGWTAPTWPECYGGGGLSKARAKVLAEEMARLGLRPALFGVALTMIGPLLLQEGSEEQKRRHIPAIVRGERLWCQGYSEPGAGSDLASLQTGAVADGDDFILNGQKIWTSLADKADWMFLLARTDPQAKKGEGITFLLMDMESAGVTVRPIKLIAGNSHFCETFFTDVRVPRENVVGRINGGWSIAKALLGFERSAIGGMFKKERPEGDPLVALARRYIDASEKEIGDPMVRDRITRIRMDQKRLEFTLARTAENAKAGHKPGPESSILKYYGSELNMRRQELIQSILGPHALGWSGEGVDPREVRMTKEWLRSRGNSIEGGTSEIQLNIIAKRVLGLPE
ncbi:MAG: acyl-CoA dehydrogenase family protein [Deltaproteobacteria bacterium]|nr:acyl-CoA dehydrogenase family protein [Deltaproteobacteria bacterium]